MNTKQKNEFYNAVMNSNSTYVNESKKCEEYFTWYSNMEDVYTGDMTPQEIHAYRVGWKLGGPYKTKEEAFNAIKEKSDNDILEYWCFYEDQYFDDYNRRKAMPSDKTKLEYMKSVSNYSIDEYGIVFGSEDFGINEMVYNVKTQDEIDRHLGIK